MHYLPDFLTPCTKKSRTEIFTAEDGYRPLLASWLLEISLTLGWYKKAYNPHHCIFENEAFVRVTGITVVNEKIEFEQETIISVEGSSDIKPIKFSEANMARVMKAQLAKFRKLPIQDHHALLKNIELLGHVTGLTRAEKAILCFVSVLDVFLLLKTCLPKRDRKYLLTKLPSSSLW